MVNLKKIKRLRKTMYKSINAAAAAAGISRQAWWAMERCGGNPTSETLRAVAKALKCSTDELYVKD